MISKTRDKTFWSKQKTCTLHVLGQFTTAINTNEQNSCACAGNQGIHKGTVTLILNLYKSSGFFTYHQV